MAARHHSFAAMFIWEEWPLRPSASRSAVLCPEPPKANRAGRSANSSLAEPFIYFGCLPLPMLTNLLKAFCIPRRNYLTDSMFITVNAPLIDFYIVRIPEVVQCCRE